MPIITIEETNLNILTGEVTVTTREIQESTLVPQTLTPRQFRLALLQVGLLDDVEAMTAQSREHQIYFEYSLDFERNHPLLVTMASAIGLSDTQIDDLFILGGAL